MIQPIRALTSLLNMLGQYVNALIRPDFGGIKSRFQTAGPARDLLRGPWSRGVPKRWGASLREDRGTDPSLKLRCPILLYRPGEPRAVKAVTEEISRQGFYCISPEVFAPLDRVECEVTISLEGLPKSTTLRCRAEVLRLVADRHLSGYGVVCRVLDWGAEPPFPHQLSRS
jgi:PilZ domain-containing protein